MTSSQPTTPSKVDPKPARPGQDQPAPGDRKPGRQDAPGQSDKGRPARQPTRR